jgi:hypothetical protein
MSESQGFGSERERREWEAQERALQQERLGLEVDGREARVGEYRLIARALRDPPLDPIPDDFAARIAARAKRERVADDRFEAWLQNGLLGLLAAAGVGTAAAFGGQWLPVLGIVIFESAARRVASWGAAILVCIAISSALEHWRRRR